MAVRSEAARSARAGERSEAEGRVVPFAEAFRFRVKLGFISFGGPAGQIAVMHRGLVERRRWISEERFLHALNYCMMLPGPEAQQLAIYIGWLMHRTWGGIVAGAFFVIPSVFVLLALSYVYAAYGNVPAVAGVLAGFKPVVVAIVVEAVLKIGGKALKRRAHYVLAAAAFVAIYFLHVPFPLIVLAAAGSYGWLTQAQAVDGLALPETTPGPLIMVLQFVGFMAGWNNPEGLSRPLSAVVGGLVTTYATFLPCFIFIFLGAPYIEVLRGNRNLTGALTGITAAVVGVVLNLALIFGAAVIWRVGDRADGLLRLFVVTPNMHKAHHSRLQEETDTNYSNIFSFWDRLCGTYTPRVDFRELRYGLDGFDDAGRQSLRGLLRMPLVRF